MRSRTGRGVEDVALVLAALGALAIGLRAATLDAGPVGALVAGGALLLAAGLAAVLALPREHRRAVAVACVSLGAAAYLGELYLRAGGTSDQSMESAAMRRGVVPDRRLSSEVIRDLRNAGTYAVPAMIPSAQVAAHRAPNAALFVVGGVRNAVTVYCNESGQFHPYRSDRFGFNNPDHVWDAGVEIVIVGDSYAHGACTSHADSIAGMVAQQIPGTINLGMSGNGPLLELASLREYGAAVRPRVLVWLFFEGNDLGNLIAEGQLPVLRSYLRPDFNQSLAARQDEIDAALRASADALLLAQPESENASKRPLADLGGVAKLREVRRLLLGPLAYFGGGGEAVRQEIAPENLELLRATLLAAKQQVGEADGRVLFVYLPSDTYYSLDWAKQHILATRTQVLGIAKALDLETLDLTPEFDGHPIESRFVFSGSHYNREGNEIVASAIVAAARRTRPN